MYTHGVTYSEDDYLQLSGIQHFAFCPRQWALIHVEKQWSDNYFTASGNILHENVHDPFSSEKRKDVFVSRGMAVHSPLLGISGECDAVEFTQSSPGIPLPGKTGLWTVSPVEYKRGKPKTDDCDRLQLTAQVICLEEMLACDISEASLYYGEIRRRERISITDELRDEVKSIVSLMHRYYDSGYTPKVRKSPRCRSCSLADECLPGLTQCGSAEEYIRAHMESEERETGK